MMSEEKNVHQFGTLTTTLDTVEDGMGDDWEDESTDDGVLFYVNKSGFPIDKFTWERMWTHVSKLHPEGNSLEKQIRDNKTLAEVPIPKPPVDFPLHFTIDEKLHAIQDYMNQLQYNHTGTQFFEIRKNRPLTGLMESAKEMIKEALPIKCLEAVILSVYLTNGMTSIDRFPLSFKTVFMGNTFRHVVCGVYNNGRYGALGMSRRKDLMYKDMEFKSLSDMVLDFIAAYKRYFHDVKKVKVGLPVVHDSHSYEGIVWKHLTVSPRKQKREEMCREVDRHAREMRHLPRGLTDSPRKQSVHKDSSKKAKKKSHSNNAGAPQESTDTVKQAHGSKSKLKPSREEQEEETTRKPVVSSNYQIRV